MGIFIYIYMYGLWKFQDPKDGGTLVACFTPYFVRIFPEIKT